MIVTLTCVTLDNKGTITMVGNTITGNESIQNPCTKGKLIEYIRNYEKSTNTEAIIVTPDKTKVHIISDKWFRTDGDQTKENDLVKLDKCK